MTRSVLFVGHGTRNPDGVAQCHALMDAVAGHLMNGHLRDESARNGTQGLVFHRAFLELVDPDIRQGLEHCVEQGASEIILAPLLLFAAGHWKTDIPCEIESAMAVHSEIVVRLSEALGIDQQIMDVVAERCNSVGNTVGDTAILLVGRGNRDSDATAEFEELARQLQNRFSCRQVETAVMVGLGNSVEQGLNRCRMHAAKVVVVPYLLFSGLVHDELKMRVAKYHEANPQGEIQVTACLWPDDRIAKAFAERIRVAL